MADSHKHEPERSRIDAILERQAQDAANPPAVPERREDADDPRFCPECGSHWITHDGDGSCVQDEA